MAEFETIKDWWNNREENDVAWRVSMDKIRANGYNLDIKNPHQPEAEKEYSSEELLDRLAGSFEKSNDLLAILRKELG